MEYMDFLILGIGDYIYQNVKRKIKKTRKTSSRAVNNESESAESQLPETKSTDIPANENPDFEIPKCEDPLNSLVPAQEYPQREEPKQGKAFSDIKVENVGYLLVGSSVIASAAGENSKAIGFENIEQQNLITINNLHIHQFGAPTSQGDQGRNLRSIENDPDEQKKEFNERDEKIVNELSAKLEITRDNQTKFICPFMSNENVIYDFNEVYINLPFETNNSSSQRDGDDLRANRFLIDGKYGSGKTTFIFKTIRDIYLGKCPLIPTNRRIPIIIYCDLRKYDEALKNESVHDILLGLCRKYHPDVTTKLLGKCSKHIFCFLNGFDNLTEDSRKKVLKFFKRDSIENPSPFYFSTLFLASSILNRNKQLYFDKTITMKGIPKDSSFALVSNIFGENTAAKDVFLNQLKKLDLTFLLEMSPWMVHCACLVHDRIGGNSRGFYLRSLLRLQVKEYILKQNPEKKRLNLTNTIKKIGEMVYKGSRNQCCTFSEPNLNDRDLKIILDLGWLKRNNDDKTFAPIQPILLEVIVVEYLNSSVAKLKLEDQIQRFHEHVEREVNVVIDISNEYVLKQMYVTRRDKLFIVSLSNQNEYEYSVNFHIHRDFEELLENRATRFSIDITKAEGKKFEDLDLPISAIPFKGEHFLRELMGMSSREIIFSLQFSNIGIEDSSTDNTLTLYSYSIHVQDGRFGFHYQLKTKNSDFSPITNFVKGINELLLTWNFNDFVSFISNLAIISDLKNLEFTSRVLKIAFGFPASEDDLMNTQSCFQNLSNYMNSYYGSESYILEIQNFGVLSAFLDYKRLNFLISPSSSLLKENAKEDFFRRIENILNQN